MNSLKKASTFFSIPTVKHFLFWLGVYTYFIGTVNMDYYSGYQEIIERYAIYVLCQVIVAYTCLCFLIPRFLTLKKNIQFAMSLLLLLVVVFVVFVGLHEYYHFPKYFEADDNSIYDSNKIFWKKLLNLRIFLGKSAIMLTPTILLVIAKFYKEKQTYLQLNEQKKSTELSVLKHQLNPHFLFNTLNSLYALSINKSDEAPEVIAKLSEMLDYMLYGCNDKYVSLKKEIELIENYLALEKVRYDERVAISFNKNVEPNVRIAPLILLTFIENAFKHGVSQELKKAYIHIKISIEETFIQFDITNSIAKNRAYAKKETIGLTNVKKQLELLYLDNYSLDLKEETNCFNVRLKLPVK
jgi:sensor histidine kinase YesM